LMALTDRNLKFIGSGVKMINYGVSMLKSELKFTLRRKLKPIVVLVPRELMYYYEARN